MKIRLFFLLFILTTNIISQTIKEDNNLLFKNITETKGLSHNTVYTVAQDSTGYIWFGTRDGLNRYDGLEFNVYRSSDGQNGVVSRVIRSLLVDNSGNLWVAGNKGISLYNSEKDEFNNNLLSDNINDKNIISIKQDKKGNIWAGTSTGKIYKLNHSTNTFEHIKLRSGSGKPDYISDIHPIKNKLLIGSENGLFVLKTDTYSLHHINIKNLKLDVKVITADKNNGFWIGTEGDGLIQLDKNLKFIKQYKHNKHNKNSLSNNNVRSLQYDDNGNLWIGTFVGLSILNFKKQTFVNYYHEFGKPHSLSQNSIRCIFKDKQRGMWLGTFFGGVNYYHPSDIKFRLLNQNGGVFSLNDNVVSDIEEDNNGNIWIATNDKGLNYWDRKKNKIRYFVHNEKNQNSLSSNNIKSIVIVDNNHILAGTHKSGLNLLNIKNNTNRIFKSDSTSNSISSNSIYAMLKDHKNNIWVGTWKGLDKFNISTGKFNHHYFDVKGKRLSSDKISYLMEDSRHRIWIGTFKGLNIFIPSKNTFESFINMPNDKKTLSGNTINCIYEDSKGRIWIGTDNGLNLFDELNREFIIYTTETGLANNTIYGILEDEKGNLWLSTNMGISCFDTKDKSAINYDTSDGIQGMQFNNYSFSKTSDGMFMFGGINGITYFKPKMLNKIPFNPNVIITELNLFNKKVFANDETGILKKHISKTPKITLKNNQNTILLKYISFNLVTSHKVTYQHMLEGFDNYWQVSLNKNVAEYSNLPYGNYIFKVRAINEDGNASKKITSLVIDILPPWWKSTWAVLAYFIIGFLLLWSLYYFMKERLRTQNEIKIERLEKKKLNEINQMKLQFFTNITHEFRTPLTLILSPLQKINEKKLSDAWLSKQHELIYKNAKRLLNLVDQLMDFRKSELGTLKLKVSKSEFVSFINEIYLSFAEVASQNNIIYTFDTKIEKKEMLFDSGYIEKIAFNLLSNAFKFTPSGGTIGILLKQTGKFIVLEVSDSGKGIPADKQSLIFDRFYRIDETSSRPGSGIGLALTKRLVELHHGTITVNSQKGKGSVFIVKIPANSDVYDKNEIYTNEETKRHNINIVPDIDVPYEDNISDISYDNEDKETIIIIEDNQEIIEYLKDNLSEKYNIYTANNGNDGLALVNKHMPTLIISDIMMPGLDGISFCKKVKRNIKTSHIPVILLTAKTSIENHIEGIEMGADDYITKPFVMNLLESKISNLIKSRKRLKEIYSKSIDVNPEKIAFNNIDEDLLKKAVNIVESNLADINFTVDIFAREMGMSRSNLHLKLKAVTGESATDFIKKIRFNKAVNLINERKYNISEISYMVGFNTPSYFSTSFKKYFGCLPSEYLQQKNKQI